MVTQYFDGKSSVPIFASGLSTSPSPTAIKSAFAVMTLHATEVRYQTLEMPTGTYYQVTSGKTLYITRIIYVSNTAAKNIELGYSDTAVPYQQTAPTNYTKIICDLATQGLSTLVALVANVPYTFDCWLPIPTGKYLTMYHPNDAQVPILSIFTQGIEI